MTESYNNESQKLKKDLSVFANSSYKPANELKYLLVLLHVIPP